MPASRNRISRITRSRLQLAKLSRGTSIFALIGALVACGESAPVGPNVESVAQPEVPAQSPVPVPPPFKEPSSPAHIYQETGPLYAFLYSMHGGILVSRYVLYDSGSFALEFASPGFGLFAYKGKYVRSGTEIRFLFDAASVAGPWDAIATTDGAKIRVDYNGIMIGSDFESGVYLEKPPAP